MTELEFEKACRGVERGVPGEFAWGNASAVAATTISGNEDGTETITNAQANVNYNGGTFINGDPGTGTLRVGIFAKSGTGRTQAGASYYGIMDLSGNVEETVVTVGNTQGRAFTGVHGSGNLNPSGRLLGNEASDWQGGSLTTRGGNWNDNFLRIRVSDRNRPGTNNNQNFKRRKNRAVKSSHKSSMRIQGAIYETTSLAYGGSHACFGVSCRSEI